MKRFCVLPLLLTLSAACDRKPEQAPAANKPVAEAAEKDDHKEEANVVKVEPGMMRDLRITTTRVEARTGAEEVQLLGELQVDQRAYAEVSVPIVARVTRLLVAEGASVREGQPLAELSTPELGRARAEFLTAASRLKLAESVLQRKGDLAAEKIAPLREVQEAEAAVTEAQAAVRSARAAMAPFGVPPPTTDDEHSTGSTFHLRSPIRGSVIERTAVVGQTADPSAPMFKIGELSRLWLTVHAFERDAVRLKPGAAARLTFAAMPGQTFPGKVSLLGRQVETESRTIPVRIDVSNPGGVLRPGMSATAAVRVGETGGQLLAVPVGAVQRVRNEWAVFLPKAEGSFEIRTVGRGRDLGGEVEILSGLKAGETIVVDGAFLLRAQAEKRAGGHDEH